jgi:hypothetical protein
VKRYILAILLACLVLVATAAPAFAVGRPGIGGSPPGTVVRNGNADENPSPDNRTEPRTGGIKFAESCDKPASFCQPG